jgi:hypothetical protein
MKEQIDRQGAIEIARQYYEEDHLAEDISARLEDDDRFADLKEQIAEELLQEKTQELHKMSDDDLLIEAGLDGYEIAGPEGNENQRETVLAGKGVISLEQARADVLTAFEKSLTDEGDLAHVVMSYYEAELPSEDAFKLAEEYNRVVGPGKLIFVNEKPHIEVQDEDDDE